MTECRLNDVKTRRRVVSCVRALLLLQFYTVLDALRQTLKKMTSIYHFRASVKPDVSITTRRVLGKNTPV